MSNLHVSSLVTLLNRAADLKLLPRTGWLFVGVRAPESVADHVHGVALLAMALADAINVDPAAEGLDAPLDVEALLRMALLHDLAESVITDLPKRSAEQFGNAVKLKAERAALRSILAQAPNAAAQLALWDAYATRATPEARLLKDVDKLEMVHQALRYEQSGQRGLDEFWVGHTWHYSICERLFAALVAARPS